LLADPDRFVQVSVVRDACPRNGARNGDRLDDDRSDPGGASGARFGRCILRNGDERFRRVLASAPSRQLHGDRLGDRILTLRAGGGFDHQRRDDVAELFSRNGRGSDSDPDSDADPDSDSDPDRNCHADGDTDPDPDADRHPDVDTDRDADVHPHRYPDPDADSDAYRSDRHTDADSHSDGDVNADGDSDPDGHPTFGLQRRVPHVDPMSHRRHAQGSRAAGWSCARCRLDS
jgi:hypothetical protein